MYGPIREREKFMTCVPSGCERRSVTRKGINWITVLVDVISVEIKFGPGGVYISSKLLKVPFELRIPFGHHHPHFWLWHPKVSSPVAVKSSLIKTFSRGLDREISNLTSKEIFPNAHSEKSWDFRHNFSKWESFPFDLMFIVHSFIRNFFCVFGLRRFSSKLAAASSGKYLQ